MNVRELISYLEDIDPDTVVIMSTDSEGNETHYADVQEGYCDTSEGCLEEIHQSDLNSYPAARPAVIFWPSYVEG